MTEERPATFSPNRAAYVLVVGVCLALGALAALEGRHMSVTHGVPLDWPVLFASTAPRWLVLGAVLPFVLWLAARRALVPFRPAVWAPHLAVMLLLSAAVAVVDAWSVGIANPFVTWTFPWVARVTRSWYSTLPVVVSMYAAVLGAAWAIAETRERQRRSLRASQLEAQLQSARLAALRAQVQPHFLYNTLNGIAALVADVQPDRAVAAIEQLAELLHVSLRDDDGESVTVDEEMALAERYLALQQMRFGDRLRCEIVVAPGAGACLVPVLLLQPVIENAVVHGLEAGSATLQLVIRAEAAGERLVITVEDDGPGPAVGGRPGGHGVGLAATGARLATAWGDAASVSLLPRTGGGTTVRILLPMTPAETDEAGSRFEAVAAS